MKNGGKAVVTRRTGRSIQVAILVTVLLAANTFLGFSLAQESERALSEQIRSRMMDLACSAAAQLDGDSLGTISGPDANNPAYSQAMETLRAYQNNVDIAYVYFLRKSESNYVYIVDPADNPADYGEAAVRTDALEHAGNGAPSVDLVAYENRWGRFYSAYCPVMDSAGGVAGVVGVDFEAAWYEDCVFAINWMIVATIVASLVLALIAIVIIARMSRAEARHEEDLEHANRYDALTGLPNMGHFLNLAEDAHAKMIAKSEKPAMLYIDLANMGAFNSKHGFAEGDKLLKAFAELLAKSFGHEHCSRFGQDHFAVMTSDEGLDARLDALIEKVAHINGGVSLPVRIGVNLDSQDSDFEASAACDHAKTACDSLRVSASSAYVYYSNEMRAADERRQHIVDNLDRAVSEGWVTVNFQPIIRSSTGRVCEEESLARWNDPKLGSIPPSEFMPVLESAGIAYKLDLHILDLTLAKMKRMGKAGFYVVPASVNLSRSDFAACDIVDEVRSRVDASGLGRDKISVEITETAMGRDFEFMSTQVDRFHELGFRVWMDDFGSEYSSLDYLQSLHFDLLKLDMRFMQQFEDGNVKSKVILTELVKMALGLGIDVVAEGVETHEQTVFLRKIGCGMQQGFYFCTPKTEEQILKRYENGTAVGFENPEESDYYSSLGRVNLYDLSSVASDDEEMQGYFSTLPMAVLQCSESGFSVLRCNGPYYRLVKNILSECAMDMEIPYAQVDPSGNDAFLRALRECCKGDEPIVIDDSTHGGQSMHAFARRVAVNPVTGMTGVAVAILTISNEQ